MTSDNVRQLVQQDIGGDWQRSNAHGCDLRRCLVTPVLFEYDDIGIRQPDAPAGVVRLWLVLEESPESRDGYKIVFSEQTGMYGLAVPGTERDVFIGFYGTFLETYEAM